MKKIIVFISISFLFLVAFFSFPKSDEPEYVASSDSFMDNVKMIHVTAGAVDWTAEIDKVVIDPASNTSTIQNIKFIFHENDVTAFAEHGRYDMLSDDLLLTEHVTARKNSFDIITDSIFWNADENSLNSDSHVLIKGESISVEGSGLKITNKGRMIIKDNVKAINH